MKAHFMVRVFTTLLVLCLSMTLTLGATTEVGASTEDAALFFEELSAYGTWLDYDKYGPVWVPNRVEAGWRPYTNGRWTPTEAGYVFETDEPWGWATYHYGNWMPTEAYGWVWVPGRTWYPNTVNWRTNDDYIGWAPIPPAGYEPPPSYAPFGGTAPGSSLLELITAPLYIFVKAASFLLGFGLPYSPSYSYLGCGALAPVAYIPVIYPQTYVVTNYVLPSYYPAAMLVGGVGAYAWGPPVHYVSKVTRINQTVINNYIRQVKIVEVRNAMVPAPVLARRPFLRPTVPPVLMAGRHLPKLQPAVHKEMVETGLAKGNLLRGVTGVPPLPAILPKAKEIKVSSGQGLPGTALPPRATHPPDSRLEARLKELPPSQRLVPAYSPRHLSVGEKGGPGGESVTRQPWERSPQPPVGAIDAAKTGSLVPSASQADVRRPAPGLTSQTTTAKPESSPAGVEKQPQDRPILGRYGQETGKNRGVPAPEQSRKTVKEHGAQQVLPPGQRSELDQKPPHESLRKTPETMRPSSQEKQQRMAERQRELERQRQQQAEEHRRQAELQHRQQLREQQRHQDLQRQQQMEQWRRQQEMHRQQQMEQARRQQEWQRQQQLEQAHRHQEMQRQRQVQENQPRRPSSQPQPQQPPQPQKKDSKKKPPWEPQ